MDERDHSSLKRLVLSSSKQIPDPDPDYEELPVFHMLVFPPSSNVGITLSQCQSRQSGITTSLTATNHCSSPGMSSRRGVKTSSIMITKKVIKEMA